MFRKKDLIGKDESGNQYYSLGTKRWVEYAGKKDPTTISADWYLWLHYATVTKAEAAKMVWQIPRAPNQTGTNLAYNPRNNLSQQDPANRARKEFLKKGDYEPWLPQ